MLPAFVIGLREGLETVVILGAIAVFLRVRGRSDLLPRIWRVSALAALICLAVALVIRFVEINLGWRQQEQLESIVGLAAVCMVTYMVLWMRRFPKDLEHDSQHAADAALTRGSERALVALAFFAVLREGFEIAVFVIATIGLSGDNAWLATGGALLGIVVALGVGIGIVGSSRHFNVAKFFRISAFVLVLSAAGIAMATVHSANAAGWITFGQTPQFDLSWLAPPGSVLSSITTGMFGLEPYPVLIEVIAWLAYFVPMVLVVLWPTSKVRAGASQEEPAAAHRLAARPFRFRPRWSWRWIAALTGVVVIGAATTSYLLTSGPSTARPAASGHSPTSRILYATLDDVTCPASSRCLAVGEFLPVDKDAAIGDPDGDGRATHTLVEVSDGRSWRRIPSPDQGKGGAVLSSIACPTARDCTAVGFYRTSIYGLGQTSAPPSHPLIETFNGKSWRVVTGPSLPPNSVLSSVSCPSTSRCIAVGATTTELASADSAERLFVESFAQGSWRLMSAPSPPAMSASLGAVSCPTATACVAVGDVAPLHDPSATRPFIEALANGDWHEASLPSNSNGAGILYDVSCVAIGHCIAVGNSVALRASGSALVLKEAGSTWRTDPAVLAQRGDATLTAIACTNATSCIVTGSSSLSLDDAPVPVLAQLDDAGWQGLDPPAVADDIDAVACPVATHCVGVGSVTVNDFGNTTSLVASLSAKRWVPEPNQIP